MKLTRLDQSQIQQYHHLDESDDCYCLGLYHPGQSYTGCDLNQLIYNLKKKPTSKNSNPQAYRHKRKAILRISSALRQSMNESCLNNEITLVPVPPSGIIGDPDYDDRILQICNQMVKGLDSPHVLDLLSMKKPLGASHLSAENRPSKDQLENNLQLNTPPTDQKPRPYIILVDDVITSGAHYSACKEVLTNHYPNVMVTGMFVARVDHSLLPE